MTIRRVRRGIRLGQYCAVSTLTPPRTRGSTRRPHQPRNGAITVWWRVPQHIKFLSVGGNLLSHSLPGAVPSARAGLASGFGKGPGVSPPPSTTDTPTGACTTLTRSEHMHLSPPANPPPQAVGGVLCQTLHSGRENISSYFIRGVTYQQVMCWCLSAH